jgi:hypothetical protein
MGTDRIDVRPVLRSHLCEAMTSDQRPAELRSYLRRAVEAEPPAPRPAGPAVLRSDLRPVHAKEAARPTLESRLQRTQAPARVLTGRLRREGSGITGQGEGRRRERTPRGGK